MVPAAAFAKLGGIFITALGTASGVAIAASIVTNLIIAAILGKILAPDVTTGTKSIKGLQTVIRSPIASRRVCYGEAILGGPYLMLETVGDTNQTLNMIIALTGHPIDDVLGVYLDDEYINIAGNTDGTTNADSGTNDLSTSYWVDSGKFGTGEAANHVRIVKNLGWGYADKTYVTDETVFTESINDRERGAIINSHITTAWTQPSIAGRDSGTGLYPDSGYKVTNCAYVMVSLLYNRDVWSGLPKIKFHIRGKRLYNPNLDSSLVSEGADSAGTHDLTDGETWEWTENCATCILDYLLDTSYGLAARTTGQLTEIDWSEHIQAVKDSDDILVNGYSSPFIGTAPRYTINGVFEVKGTPISIMESLLTSGSAELIYSQGTYKLRVGKYRAPNAETDIINEDMIVSALNIRTHTPRSDVFNKAAGIYIDTGYNKDNPITAPANLPIFEATDFPIVDPLDSSGLNPFELIDGEEIIKEFDYPFTIYEFEAQRLARIQLERIRQGLVIQFEADLQVLKFSVGDTIYLEILSDSKYANESFFNRLGLDDAVQGQDSPLTSPYYKQFKITDMQYTETFNIAVTLIEESEEIYDWNEGDANKTDYVLQSELIIDDPTGTVLVPSFDLQDSPNQPVTEFNSWPNTSTVVRWRAPERGSVVNALDRAAIGSYELEYGKVTDPSLTSDLRVADWIFGGRILSNTSELIQGPISLENLFIDEQTDFDFRIRSITYLGRASNWAYYSEDIGLDFSPTAPRSTEVSVPVAGQKTLIYDTQITATLDTTIGLNLGEFILTDAFGNDPQSFEDVVTIRLCLRDVDDFEHTKFLNASRNGDIITFYISPKRWFKYRMSQTNGIPFIINTTGFSPLPVDEKTVGIFPEVEVIDFKESDPNNSDLITTDIEFRFERDNEDKSINNLLDTDFDRSTGLAFSESDFWSFNDWGSPNIVEFRAGEGQDGSNAVYIEAHPSVGLREEPQIQGRTFFRNPTSNIKATVTYQSISGTSTNMSISYLNIGILGEDFPHNRVGGSNTGNKIYLPPTPTGEWGKVSKILNVPNFRYTKISKVALTNDPVETEILDILIDSVILEETSINNVIDGILISNTVDLSFQQAKTFSVDMSPATGNITINIVSNLETDESGKIDILTIQDTTDRTITWQSNGISAAVLWAGGTVPTPTSGSGAQDLYTFKTIDGGSALIGSVILNVQ